MTTVPLPKWSGENMENAITYTAGFAKQITVEWGKTQKLGGTGPRRFARGHLDPQHLHREEKKATTCRAVKDACNEWGVQVCLLRDSHSHLWNTKQLQGALDCIPRIKTRSPSTHSSSLPPYGDWGNYSQLKYHHVLRYELTKTYYSFAPQNGRSTHRKICLETVWGSHPPHSHTKREE